MESSLNSTTTPLKGKSVFLGKWEKVLYSCAYINIYSDTDCEIKYYSSQSKQTELNVTTIQYVANQPKQNYCISLPLPYILFNVINKSSNEQTILNFSVVYKNDFIELENKTIPILDNIVNNTYTRGSSLLWDNTINADSNTLFYDLTNKQVKLLTFYGVSSSNTTLTLVFSNDNIIFYKSQYTISILANQSFGFSLATSPLFVGFHSNMGVAGKLTIHMNYS